LDWKVGKSADSGPVLDNFEPQIVAAALKEARNPNNVPAGELRKIEKSDAFGRVEQVDFIDQESFVKLMGRPKVVGIAKSQT
jgi:hypothetical protein